MKKQVPFLLLFGFFLLPACRKQGQLTETPFQHFRDEGQAVELVLATDMGRLLAEQEKPTYQPIELILKKNNCLDEHFSLEAKPRGVFRRANCAFPPLKLRFPDEVLAAGGFLDYPTLKLVTHCRADPGFNQLILKEYLVFKLYNQLTDNSFRTQLAKITYCDSEKKYKNIERFGFLIEHPRELADRMNGRILGEEYGAPKKINLPAYKIFTLFQYMVGNTDWGLGNRHNVKLVLPKKDGLKLPVPVPYDFDFCGLVDAPYAVPHHSHPISDVKERYFQWRGGDADFTDVFDLFKNKKEELLGIVNGCEYLDGGVRAEMLGYLGSFFEVLERPEEIIQASKLGGKKPE
ncbi:MAG TPA: hypothetical protein ENJ95_10870 [Bacteroidetes bacterium]|nr:hypothetical protein [Bacteroidota bacterium]